MNTAVETPGKVLLTEGAWIAAERDHQDAVRPWVDDHQGRASESRSHPVYDFLWKYYNFRPSQLLSWSPGVGYALQGEASKFLRNRAFVKSSDGVEVEPGRIPLQRREGLDWIVRLLESVHHRKPQFGCAGMHEWAMVYDAERERRHDVPLRLPQEEVNAFVEAHPIRCSHFDAYRFFTPGARPLNQVHPAADTKNAFEQKGCLHVNMDLYKWAFKFFPWISSECLRNALAVAVEARRIDMRASPYDLSFLELTPICIETREGREAYRNEQRRIMLMAEPIRARLLQEYRQLQCALEAD